MKTTTATIRALHVDAGPAALLVEERPAYRYAGNGKFLPANHAAHEECAAWNRWADAVNARTATRSAP